MRKVMKKMAAAAAAGTLAFTTFLTVPNVQAVENSDEQTGGITQFMDCFQPMPIIEGLTEDCWGNEMVGARDQGNGLEDRDLSDYSYWDGGIIKDEESGKYYMFASRWNQAGGHWGQDGISGWQGSQAIYAVSDNLYGPYEDMGPIWPDWCDGAGHNVFAFEISESDPLYQEGYKYAISVSDTGMHGDIANGTIHIAKSLEGPWDLIDNGNGGKLNAQGGSGFSLSNVSIMVRPDGRYEATNRNGDIAIADSLEGIWEVQTNGLWWQIEGMPNSNVEDPVIWYSDGLYHIVANKWDAKEAYYMTSEDGITGWVRHSGIAYTPKQNFLTYEDGTENNWTKLERPNVYIEDGTIKAVTFAVIDVEKEQDFGNDGHGSKIIVVPFDGEALKEFAKTDVYVDPMADREGIEPIDDSTAQSWGNENTKNWGGEYFLQLQRNTSQGLFGEGERPDSGYDCKIAYIKYDISDYIGKEVESAYLSIVYQGLQAGSSTENQIEAALAASDWEEGIGKENDPGGNGNIQETPEDLIWSNQPAILYAESGIEDTVTAVSDVFSTQTAPAEIRVDVTELVKMYMEAYPDETEITFALSEMNGNRLHIGSKEGGDTAVPKLDIKSSGEIDEPEGTVSKNTLEYFLNSAKEHLANGDVDDCVQSIKDLFDEAIAEGDAVMADENATREEVMNASVKLMKAVQAIDMKAADKTDLEMAVELAEMIDLTDYIDAGQQEFTDALAAANAVLADGDAMQAETDNAWNALVDAMANLRLKADKAALEDLLNEVAGLDLTQYTEESAAVFRTALASAQAVLEDDALTEDDQETVDNAVAALMSARDGLTAKADDSGNGSQDGNADVNQGGNDNNNSSGTDGNKSGTAAGSNDGNNTGGSKSGTDSGTAAGKAAKTGDVVPVTTLILLAIISGTAIIAAARRRTR